MFRPSVTHSPAHMNIRQKSPWMEYSGTTSCPENTQTGDSALYAPFGLNINGCQGLLRSHGGSADARDEPPAMMKKINQKANIMFTPSTCCCSSTSCNTAWVHCIRTGFCVRWLQISTHPAKQVADSFDVEDPLPL